MYVCERACMRAFVHFCEHACHVYPCSLLPNMHFRSPFLDNNDMI